MVHRATVASGPPFSGATYREGVGGYRDDGWPDESEIEALIVEFGERNEQPSLKDRRRAARTERWAADFGADAEAALDLLAIADSAWRETYDEDGVPALVLDDLLVTSQGNLVDLIEMLNLALTDWRDLRVNADEARKRGPGDG